MATIRLIPSAYTLSNTSALQISNAKNMYTNIDSTTYAQITHNSGNTTAYYLYIHGFNFNDVPSGATIKSFTVKIKGNESNLTSAGTTYAMSLYNNTTSIANTSAGTLNTTVSAYTFPNGSLTWDTIKGYGNNFRIRVPIRRNARNTSGYARIYGAEIEVNYTLVEYQITSISNTDLVTAIDPEGTTTVGEGEDYVLDIYADSMDNVVVEDNGVDVTSQLVRKQNTDTGGTIDAVAQSNFETGFSNTGASFYMSNSSQGTTNLEMAIGYTAENPNTATDQGNGYTYVKDGGNNTATGWIIYGFDFSSIPANATIESVSIKAFGCRETSTTDSTHVAKLGAYAGTTLKGSEQEFSSTGNSIMTMSNIGTWTREELQNAKLRFTVAYYGGRIKGITWSVTYTVSALTEYYWEYTLTNVATSHTIYVKEGIIIPPEEDPDKEYYPITISSINAITDPTKGTTRVESGTSETITIYPSDPLMTLVTDNGVDISSQLVQHGGTIPDPTVTTSAGASYGFNLNSNTGYYVSANNGVDKTAAVCRVAFDLPVRCLVTISFINYAEQGYDFGVFGNVDTALNTNYYAAGGGGATITDASYKLACNTSTYNTSSVQTLTYEIPSGEHFIDIKYSKDDATSSNNDTLQWKITSIEALEPNNYYTYTLSNINQAHSLIFIFGNVTYYFVESQTSSDCTLYPNGQMVQLPGEEYRLTVVPNNSADTVTVRDNNVDVTNQLERKEVTTEKGGVQITVVNYIYRINNVQTGHTINVVSTPQGLDSYIKVSSQWSKGDILRKQDDRWGSLKYNKLYIKQNGEWVADVSTSITTTNMVFGGVLNNGE